MKALRRNKQMYEFMMTFEHNPDELKKLTEDWKKANESLSQAIPKNDFRDKDKTMIKGFAKFEMLLRLSNLKYMELIRLGEIDTLTISNEGWKFCESYEQVAATKRTNFLLLLIAIPAAIYYTIEIAKFFVTISNLWGSNCH